jgi:hypothetical protein
VFSVAVRLHDNFHILVERYQEAQKAFHGKLTELTAQHLRNIGLAVSEQAGGLYLFEAARFLRLMAFSLARIVDLGRPSGT